MSATSLPNKAVSGLCVLYATIDLCLFFTVVIGNCRTSASCNNCCVAGDMIGVVVVSVFYVTILVCFPVLFVPVVLSVCQLNAWRRNSVVRTSVCGWQAFPDLCLTYGRHVTTSWIKCPPWVNQPGQVSLRVAGQSLWAQA